MLLYRFIACVADGNVTVFPAAMNGAGPIEEA